MAHGTPKVADFCAALWPDFTPPLTVPDEMIRAWREAAIDIANDPEFLERARPEVGDYPWVVGDDLESTQEALLGAGGEGVDRWLTYLEEHEGIDVQR